MQKPAQAIQMVDLHRQYQEIKTEIDQAIAAVLKETRFIKGRQVTEFERELAAFLHCKHVIACANGTDALQIALMALGLKPGDEIITSAFTYAATAEVIGLLGLTPVLVDVDPHTFNLDPTKLEAALSAHTKAIVPVHLFGQSSDMEPILEFARQHKLRVIEDTAQAIGGEYTFSNGYTAFAGTMGDIGTTSFFPSKNLGCYGDGGALMTNDDELAQTIRMIANHGQKVQYFHDVIGVNSRLDTLQAAVLQVKLKYLEEATQRRQDAADYYDSELGGLEEISIPGRMPNATHVFHQYTLQVKGVSRTDLKKYLASVEIPSMVYYPKPLHHQKAFSNALYEPGSLPNAEKLSEIVLSLPMSPNLLREEQDYIIYHIKEFIKNNL